MKKDKRFIKFFYLFNVTEEDAISHYTATTEISETNDDEDENGAGSNNNNGNGNSKKRTKIRTNPHVVKGCGTLEKKAKNRQKRQKSVASSSDIDQQSTKSSEFDTEVEIEPNDIVDDDYDQVAENSLEDSFEKGAKKPPIKSPNSEKLPKNPKITKANLTNDNQNGAINDEIESANELKTPTPGKNVPTANFDNPTLDYLNSGARYSIEADEISEENSEIKNFMKKSNYQSQLSNISNASSISGIIPPNTNTKRRVIERVDTDDCTSIDTTTMTEEIIMDPRKIQGQGSEMNDTT